MPSESRGWFERGIFDLAIGQAHLQSGLWLDAAKLARQAALKFLQAAIVKKTAPDPSPRVKDLVAALSGLYPNFQSNDRWRGLDEVLSAEKMEAEEAKAVFQDVEEIRDAVAKVLG